MGVSALVYAYPPNTYIELKRCYLSQLLVHPHICKIPKSQKSAIGWGRFSHARRVPTCDLGRRICEDAVHKNRECHALLKSSLTIFYEVT